ncbi:uncharacterized protein PgNI_10011 [Pyricularia grisea]|uniref:Zn(2)-C6 fungal-type domain-containing protein n=1 Tax=Pyricularia grisea TaxID=148305 RepID=A0A6P8ATK7_PYRGI|nr:uncharacterized protein PgNI_10011 [Pyricularia grisea]TLD05422.1 hypothetical protein PgNI_10011 [Pyricularia grisea]
MTSSQPTTEAQTFPTLDLDAEAHLMHADGVDLNGFQLDGTPNGSLHDDAPPQNVMDSSHFGDFQFPFQSINDESTIVAMTDASPAVDVFPPPQHRPSVSSMPADRRGSIASATGQAPSYNGNRASQRRHSQVTSEDGSPDSNGNGLLLEDPGADEFGLISRGPGDASGAGKFKDDKGETMPAWSELKTKAGKERKRLPLACIACRRKKIRCSGEKPACKHCLRSRIPCVYKVTARKAAPRTDYMAMLDKRLKRMEERIIKTVPKSEQDGIAATVMRSVLKPAIPGTLNASKAAAKKRGADEAFGPELDNWARCSTKSKTDASGRPATILLHEAEENKLLQEGADALPSREIQEHLAEVFFDDIYGQAYHLLHRPSYMRKLRAGTLPPVLILSVCAVSARFSTHPKLNTNPNFLRGEEWASHARDIVMRRYEWPNITILTCLLILGLHEFGTCHGGRSWALGGQAIRMAFALQLHKDLEYDPHSGRAQLSFIDREIRRRTMWACFLMDRFNSSGTERPTFIKEDTVKIPLPVKEKYFQLDIPGATEDLNGPTLNPMDMDEDQASQFKENMGVAAYMVRSIAIWGRIINYLNQGGKELDPHPMWSPDAEYAKLIKQSEDLPASLPDSLQYNRENLKLHDTEGMANQFLFLHISIQQNILFMNRFAVSSPGSIAQQDVPKSFVTKAGAKAFAAANRMSELLKDAEPYLVSAPFVGYCTFLSSTVHIFGIFSGNPAIETTSKRNLATNVRFLSKMKRFWGMFHFMTENLREQYRACADAARQGNPANENSPQIFQYGDWFDRYPHGVSQSDFLDPVKYRAKEKGNDAVLEQKPELATVEEFMTKMSPRSAEGAVNNSQGGKPQPAKRKSIAKRGGSTTSRSDHQPDPIMTDVGKHGPTEQQAQQQPQQQANNRRRFSGTVGGQTNAPSFSPLTIPQSANQAPYHTLSPISPVAMNAFPHHNHHHHHQNSQFYSPELLSLSLSQQTTAGILPQLDRQLVFGAYGALDPGMTNQMLDGGGIWDGMSGQRHGDGGRRTHGSTAEALHAAVVGHTLTHHHQPGHHGHEGASSAWFMPFNMEPPEIGHDLTSLDGLGAMFGGAMTTQGGMGGGGGNPNHNGH